MTKSASVHGKGSALSDDHPFIGTFADRRPLQRGDRHWYGKGVAGKQHTAPNGKGGRASQIAARAKTVPVTLPRLRCLEDCD